MGERHEELGDMWTGIYAMSTDPGNVLFDFQLWYDQRDSIEEGSTAPAIPSYFEIVGMCRASEVDLLAVDVTAKAVLRGDYPQFEVIHRPK